MSFARVWRQESTDGQAEAIRLLDQGNLHFRNSEPSRLPILPVTLFLNPAFLQTSLTRPLICTSNRSSCDRLPSKRKNWGKKGNIFFLPPFWSLSLSLFPPLFFFLRK